MSYPSSLPLHQVRLRRGWLASRAATVRDTVIPQQWEALNDRIPGAERSGCVHNLEVAAGEKAGEFHGLFWQDSDIAKWIEAASYRLATHPDAELEARLDRLIGTIARAQRSDGYLNTYFTLVEPANRWANLRDCHELYVAGHFIEAGVAHFEATGKRGLLDVVRRLADLVDRTFGTGAGQSPGYCGHEEIELALVKLARVTGEGRYRELAAYFIDQRGREPNYFALEAERRGEKALPWHMYHDGLATLQAAVPVRALEEPVGHAVRMTYLLAAMIDLAREREDRVLESRARALWGAMLDRHLYITGGVGSEPYGEKFSEPYDLPPDRAYAETCAAIGVILCARRMLDLELDGRHADAMERALYNNVLAGLSLDGCRYFYVNPLEIVPAVAKRRYECHLVKTQRVPWFGCACCPPNIARLLTSIGEYVCTRTEDGLAVHLYGGWEAAFAIRGVQARVALSTEYPWEGKVRISVSAAQPIEAALRLRIPGWCRGATLAINDGPAGPVSVENGYVAVRRRWGGEDRLVLDLPMPVERVRADPRVASAAGRVALQRGPVVYALEQTDHGPGLAALRLPSDAPLRSLAAPDLLGGCVIVETTGRRMETGGPLYGAAAPSSREVTLRAVPYALWANRGEGEMTVWIHET